MSKTKRKFLGWRFDGDRKHFFLFWVPVYSKNNNKINIKSLNKEIESIKTTYFPALANHPQVFEKMKGCHAGQDLVLVGTAPTLDLYQPIPGAIHMGVNRSILDQRIAFDYHICLDYPLIDHKYLMEYRKETCRKLYGMHHADSIMISESMLKEIGAERFYFEQYSVFDTNKRFHVDIAHLPLRVGVSVISAAFQIALWCHPRRIYIVGCDCSNTGYTKADTSKMVQWLPLESLKKEWERLANFARTMYPDIEIISINPIGLRGIFTDVSMNNGEISPLN